MARNHAAHGAVPAGRWRTASLCTPAMATSAATHEMPANANVGEKPNFISTPPSAGKSGKNGYSDQAPSM